MPEIQPGDLGAGRRRFKPYPAYKDSGVEWLGQIPAHWESQQMCRISSAVSGGTPAKENPKYWGGSIPWVSPKDMKRRLIDSSEDSITDEGLAETGLKLVAPPTVLIVVRGMILAHSFPVAVTRVPVTINQDMKALRLRHDIEPLFMAWVFEGISKALVAAVVEEAAHGTRAIRMDQWRLVTVAVPSNAEQRAIVAFLDRETAEIDALVAKKERLIELLQEKRTALISRAVTKGLDPNVPMKDSEMEWLGTIPAHWNLKRLGFLLNTRPRNGLSPPIGPEGVTPTFSTAAVAEGVVTIEGQIKYTTISPREAKPFLLLQGDVLMLRGSGSRAFVGRAGIVADKPPDGCVYPDILIRLRPSHLVTAWFLVSCLNSTAIRPAVEMVAKTAAGIWKITGEDVQDLVLPVPPSQEQLEIEALVTRALEKIDALIAKVRDAIDHLKELRTALISAAVTGKIDVREDAA